MNKFVYFHCSYSTFTLKILASALMHEQEMKDPEVGKKEIKLPLFVKDRIIYAEKASGLLKTSRSSE